MDEATQDGLDDAQVEAFGALWLRLRRHRPDPDGARLDLSAFRLLWLLEQRGPLTMREVAEALQLEQSTVSRQVTAATGRDLLERVPDAGRGPARVRATTTGERALRHDRDLRSKAFRVALATVGADRVDALVRDLTAFVDALDRAEGPAED